MVVTADDNHSCLLRCQSMSLPGARLSLAIVSVPKVLVNINEQDMNKSNQK